ncbi:hypothetical protein [Pseudohaliea rubra]|nr:hypothetical protein [Pseudohaliea rubra]
MSRLLPALLCLLAAFMAPAGTAFELPAWQQLAFEQRNFWATARGELSLKHGVAPLFPESEAAPFLRLEVQNTVGSTIESIVVDLNAGDAASIGRWRLSRGRDQRLKTHQYLPDLIKRQRREPAADGSGPGGGVGQSGWVTSGPGEVELPPEAAGRVIIAPHALFLLLPALLEDPSRAEGYLVHTDLNFYRLVASPGATETMRADFRLDEGRVEGRRSTRTLELRTEPLTGNPEGQDFELMGLSGPIVFFVDRATGLPLRVRGEAPRIGGAELNLVEALSRPAPARTAPAAAIP